MFNLITGSHRACPSLENDIDIIIKFLIFSVELSKSTAKYEKSHILSDLKTERAVKGDILKPLSPRTKIRLNKQSFSLYFTIFKTLILSIEISFDTGNVVLWWSKKGPQELANREIF